MKDIEKKRENIIQYKQTSILFDCSSNVINNVVIVIIITIKRVSLYQKFVLPVNILTYISY